MRYMLNTANAALLVVDPQVAFGSAVPVPGVEDALNKMAVSAAMWRQRGGQVIVTKHAFESPDQVGRIGDFLGDGIYEALKVGSPLGEFHPGIYRDEDTVVPKHRFSALVGTALPKMLEAREYKTVAVMGLTTPICVGTTVDALNMAGYQVVLVDDACASQPMGSLTGPEAHRAAVERARYLFAEVISAEEFVHRLEEK